MIDKLESAENRYRELLDLLSSPEIVSDREQFRKFSKESSDLLPLVEAFREYKKYTEDLKSSKELFQESDDTEMREMARAEVTDLEDKVSRIHQELMFLLIPKDPNDDKNVIVEIRAGTGGDEAALFVQDMLTAYSRFSDKKRWQTEIISLSDSSAGGLKEVIFQINGQGAYSLLKYESGVHRVQRVPKTETQGRIHTSTITVAVLPEAEEVDLEILDKDLRIDVFRSGGPGGQSVNTTDSAVRITHIPTGMVVTCQDEKSQHKNKAKALTVLRSRLFEQMIAEQDRERSADRKSQIGSGERSEKIRTYNYPQSRVTDHRIGLTIYQIDSIMAGELEILIEPLIQHYRSEALKGSN